MTDVYEIITDQVVKALESGKVPWRQPWTVRENGPRSYTGRLYRGMNVFLLLTAGYSSPYWLTFNQVKKQGGKVQKGESGRIVVFWKIRQVTDQNGNESMIPMLRYYRVWNLEQTEGIKPPRRATEPEEEFDPIARAEDVIRNYPAAPLIQHAGNQAFYRWDNDVITLPPRKQFTSNHEYYATAFHELTHSTGHSARLDRRLVGMAGDIHSYGREELIAEMGSAFLSGETGILPKTIKNSAAYLRSWINTIREDPRAVVVAAGAAQRAADHILNRTETGNDTEEE